jgi:hypothetical protein
MMAKKQEFIGEVPLTAKTLRAFAYEYLRYENGCYMVSFERSPFSARNCPDVLGLNKARQLIEIEIKVDKADFDKDMKKKHRQKLIDELGKNYPRATNLLYYLVPPGLVNHVMATAPEFAGVLTPNSLDINPHSGFPRLTVLRKALRLHDQRLSIKNCIIMARDMSGTMASLLRDDVKHTVKKKSLENQVVALGGVLPVVKRKKRKTTAKATSTTKSMKTSKKKART